MKSTGGTHVYRHVTEMKPTRVKTACKSKRKPDGTIKNARQTTAPPPRRVSVCSRIIEAVVEEVFLAI